MFAERDRGDGGRSTEVEQTGQGDCADVIDDQFGCRGRRAEQHGGKCAPRPSVPLRCVSAGFLHETNLGRRAAHRSEEGSGAGRLRLSGAAGEEGVAVDLERTCFGFAGRAGEGVDGWSDGDLLES